MRVDCESVSVAVYWILFALCSVRVRSHVSAALLREAPVQLSGLACRWPSRGPAKGDIRCRFSLSLTLSLSFLLPLSSPPTFSPPFFPLPFFSTSPPSAGFHLPVTSQAAAFLSSLHLLRAILVAEESFSALYFPPSPFVPSSCASQGSARRQYTVALE